MKQVYIIQENHPKLLLFFAGWAMDETPFRQYRPKDMDYMVCYDYRTLDFDFAVLDRYQTVNLVAWSMGVWAASTVLHSAETAEDLIGIAFNGTTCPINDIEGILVKTFLNTLDGLTPDTLQKFMRRMCGSAKAYEAFRKIAPRRDFEEVKQELACIKTKYLALGEECWRHEQEWALERGFTPEPTPKTEASKLNIYYMEERLRYNLAFMGEDDKIFPLDNQKAGFDDLVGQEKAYTVSRCAHYDAEMFRFLLQDQWEMTFDDHLRACRKFTTR